MLEYKDDVERIEQLLARQYLQQADIDQQSDDGKVALTRPRLSARTRKLGRLQEEAEIDRATQAFEHNRYKMFVDGTEVADLDELCTVREGTTINFVRLVPLVGG